MPSPSSPDPPPDKKAFLLRLPPALFERVRALAAREMRSVNAQIEFLLAEAVRRRTGGGASGAPGEEGSKRGPSGGGGASGTPGGRGSSRE